jgi:hypothetical protein
MKFAQVDNGIVTGTLDSMRPPADDVEGRVFVSVNEFPAMLSTYDAQTGTFTAPEPTVNTILSRADVIGLLTAAEWSEMNKFSPMAAGENASQIPYNDADVFYVVSLFNQAQYIDLDDERTASLLTGLVTKGIVSPQRAGELLTAMQTLAASR